MTKPALCGRADLLKLHDAGPDDPDTLIRLAAHFGYGWTPVTAPPDEHGPSEDAQLPNPPPRPGEIQFSHAQLRDVPFVQPVQFRRLGSSSALPQPRREVVEWRQPPSTPPSHPPLALWRDLEPLLRAALNLDRETSEVDVAAATERIARSLHVEHVPRRRKRRWPRRLEVIVDRASHLAPIWADQRYVVAHLRRHLPDAEINLSGLSAGDAWPRYADARNRDWVADAGGLVVALTDLGTLAADWSETSDRWLRIGHEILAAGGRAAALVPCAAASVGSRLRQTWSVLPWEQPTPAALPEPSQRAVMLQRLNVLLAPAVRVEPGLLRAVRLALLPEADASLEIAFWRQAVVESPNVVAATLAADALPVLRRAFACLDADDRRCLLAILKSWRPVELKSVWFEEVLSVASHSLDELPCREDFEDARDHVDLLAHRHLRGIGPALTTGTRAWIYRVDERAKGSIRHPSFLRLADAIRSGATVSATDGELPPAVQRLYLYQRGADLAVTAAPIADWRGALLAELPANTGLADLDEALDVPVIADGDPAFWQSGTPPRWAADWGTDAYGAWVSFRIELRDRLFEQRLRWIPPGRFLMGSPEDEPGRYDNEGPQHEVTIGEGFWLLATPVTQALYEAVTGDDPGRLKSPDRPAARVDENQVRSFLQRLNKRVPGLDLVLPSEAQWEYACRAGTTTATYAGPMPDPKRAGLAAIGDIAWFGANSRRKSQPVGLKRPNAWGLYDMLGNVWERCADHWHDRYEGAPIDGAAWLDEDANDSASCVIRGGSWLDDEARHCRAASRDLHRPDARLARVGFRPARGQGERSDVRGAVPVEAAWRGRSPPPQPEPIALVGTDGAADLSLDQAIELRGHDDQITAIDFGLDGDRILTTSLDGTARLWDVATGEELNTIRGPGHGFMTGAFTPDGLRVLTGSFFEATLWPATAGSQLMVIDHGGAMVNAVAISPDGRLAAAGLEDGTVRLSRTEDGRPVHTLEGHSASVESVSFGPDGTRLVSTSEDGTARLWNVDRGAVHSVLRGHSGVVRAASFAADGRAVVTAGGDGTVRLWDVASGAELRVLRGHGVNVAGAAFTLSGDCVLSIGWDETVRCWDARTGTPLHQWPLAGVLAMAVAFSRDRSHLAIGTDDGFMRIWRLPDVPHRRGEGRTSEPVAVRVVPGGGPQVVALPRAGAFRVRSDRAELTFRRLNKPDWASGIGRDRFGLFAELTVEEVTQCLRWIPPGRFLMGSPEGEPGRFDWEGPQREVTIGAGFWLLATPVTQALYEAVTGDNPSAFKSPDRPVESVDWRQAQGFLERLNERVAGLNLRLPSEAQWEYACRAGTETATYAGPIDIIGEHNAPILDDIAWYGGNSGVGFDLAEGEDSSRWSEKQYPHDRAGTRPVGLKRTNAWGLHDMLGNVWEWCADHWHENYEGAPGDGSAWIDASADRGAFRVVRGGSWGGGARHCRAASRDGYHPDYRDDGLGFRPARGQG